MEINKVIKKILTTEKSTTARETSNKYFFEVDRKANKVEITKAVEKLFKSKLLTFMLYRFWEKRKEWEEFVGQKSSWKKL